MSDFLLNNPRRGSETVVLSSLSAGVSAVLVWLDVFLHIYVVLLSSQSVTANSNVCEMLALVDLEVVLVYGDGFSNKEKV